MSREGPRHTTKRKRVDDFLRFVSLCLLLAVFPDEDILPSQPGVSPVLTSARANGTILGLWR